MFRRKLYLPALILSTIIIISTIMVGCTKSPDEIQNASEARDVALAYLDQKYNLDAPSSGLAWQESDTAAGGQFGEKTSEFVSGDWNTTVSYQVPSPEEAAYEVCVSSPVDGWSWKVNVDVDGSVTEIDAINQTTEEESLDIALQFIKQSPTYLFDGIEGTLHLAQSVEVSIPYTWTFIINFNSAHAGYGDRTGSILAQIITPHTISITVEQGKVIVASMDNQWDMISQSEICDDIDLPSIIAREEPDIIGTITQIDSINSDKLSGRVLVQLEEANNTSDKFWVSIENNIPILRFDDGQQTTTTFGELCSNQNVAVWFAGPVMESYPAQVSASQIVIMQDMESTDLPTIDDGNFATSIEVSIDEFISQNHIDREIEIFYPGNLVVTLGSNPTTGFSWNEAAVIEKDDILTQIEHRVLGYAEVEPTSSDEIAIVGSGGEEVWVFSAIKSGTTTLSFEYGRPWEGGEKAEWTFSLVVTVK